MPMLMSPSLLNSCRRELILMLDLLAACIVVQLLADGWMWQVVNQYRDVPPLAILHLMPGRVFLSTILTAGMLFFVIYRMTTTQCLLADRGMFVLGCGSLAGFIAHVLKFVFGRSYPDAEANYGLSSYHPFHSDVGLGSFPSAHAAMAAGIAASLAIIWPEHRRLFIFLAWLIAGARFIAGIHYPSDVLLGFATGLGAVVVTCFVFYAAGINLHQINSKSRGANRE
jgi:membrane-associated phospholipid phosphatase